MEDTNRTTRERKPKEGNCFYNLLRCICKCFSTKPAPKPDILESFDQSDFDEVWKCHEARKAQTKQEIRDISQKYNDAYPHSLVLLGTRQEMEENDEAKALRLRRERWKKQQLEHRQVYLAQKMEYQRKMLIVWMRKCRVHKHKIHRSYSENSVFAIQR